MTAKIPLSHLAYGSHQCLIVVLLHMEN